MTSQMHLDEKELNTKGQVVSANIFLSGKHANKCIGTLLRPCDGHREEKELDIIY